VLVCCRAFLFCSGSVIIARFLLSGVVLEILHLSFSKELVDLKLMGASAGLSMAAESAI
jgi:hypothetical protein